ncbi:MAG: DUF3592 domain-containing protein [Gemmatimonadota bacterium]
MAGAPTAASRASLGFVAFLLLFVGLGAVEPLTRYGENRRAAGWERTPGVVLEHREVRKDGLRGETCTVRVRYRYTVAGRERVGRLRWPGDRGACRDEHALPLRPGQTVAVYFDPERPRTSALARRHPVHGGEVAFLAMYQLVFGGLLVAALVSRRRVRVPA